MIWLFLSLCGQTLSHVHDMCPHVVIVVRGDSDLTTITKADISTFLSSWPLYYCCSIACLKRLSGLAHCLPALYPAVLHR